MSDPFDFADELGPEKVVHIHHPRDALRAIVVVDNVACGPAIGGVRMAQDVGLEECFRLARAMTFKNAAAGLPHGGGKTVLMRPKRMFDRAAIFRSFGRFIDGLGGRYFTAKNAVELAAKIRLAVQSPGYEVIGASKREGVARIAGHDMASDRLAGSARLGYLPENGPLYPDMTPAGLLEFFADTSF